MSLIKGMKGKTLALLLSGMLLSQPAQSFNRSDSVQVEVTGSIAAPPCQVTVPQSIALGSVARQLISTPGSNSSSHAVSLQLTDCPPETKTVTLTFSGPAYSEDPAFASDIYANQLEGGATDIGLQLINLDGNPLVNLGNGMNYSLGIDPQTASTKLNFAARMYTPHGNPTAGEFRTAVTINFTWQ
jgi:P pilus assembly protein, pilin FimA